MTTTATNTIVIRAVPTPCPTCGTCPTCGHRAPPAQVQPLPPWELTPHIPYVPPIQPFNPMEVEPLRFTGPIWIAPVVPIGSPFGPSITC